MFFATYCTKRLSEYDRQRLCLTLLGLNIFQIHLAAAGFCLGTYLSISVNSKAHLVKGYSLKPIGATLFVCSIVLFLIHCLGAKVSNDCCYQRTRLRWHNKLFFVILGYVIMSATILSVLIFCMIQNFKLKEALSYGLMPAMRSYLKNKNTKREIDDIQMNYRCCGSSNHTDWFEVKWIPESDLPQENDFEFSQWEYIHSVPFSCCDPTMAAPCFHRLVTVSRGAYSYPHHGFFKRGCTPVLFETVQQVLVDTTLLILMPLLVELTIIVQTRYLQTSMDDCKRQRNQNGVGRCWLFRRHPHELEQCKEGDEDEGLFSSSSEELVFYDPPKKLNVTKAHCSSRKLQSASKKRRQTKNYDENDYDDLRTLLLKNNNENGGNSRNKSKSFSNHSSKKKEKSELHDKKKNKGTNKQSRSFEHK